MAKLDLSSAYRSVKIHPDDTHHTGLAWKFKGKDEVTYMYDARLPFGSRLAPGIFHTLSQAVRRMMNHQGYHRTLAYCDDFLICHHDKHQCLLALNHLIRLCRKLGFAINYSKLVEPTTSVTFLGVNIDSNKMTVGLPGDKVQALERKLRLAADKKSINKKELQSLAGSLNWACRVIEPGKFFVRNIFEGIKRLSKPWQHTRYQGRYNLVDRSCGMPQPLSTDYTALVSPPPCH